MAFPPVRRSGAAAGVRRGAAVLAATAGAAVLAMALPLAGPLALRAVADPSSPVVPSADEVARSRQGAADTAGDVGRMEAQLAAAGVRTDRLAMRVGQAVEAYNGARVRLQRAEQDALTARRTAEDARVSMETSRDALGQFAAAAYRSGGDAASLTAYLVADSPRDLISRAAALQSIGDSRRRALEEFRAAEAATSVLENRAELLVERRRDAARRVERAKAVAESQLASQEQVVAQLATERESLVRALAAARDTTVRLERARQDGLERERAEAARRAAEELAREQARKTEAARQAEAARQEEAARQAEQRRADEKRRADEALAAEQARQAEESRRATEVRQAEESRRAAEAAQADESRKEAEVRQAEESRRAAEARAVDEQRRAAEERRAAEQRRADEARRERDRQPPAPAPPAPAPPSSGSSSGSSSGADRAIDFARSQIGRPYQWGAAGPGSYDCSGLTMRAWEQGGVGLPHYSVAQYERSEKVSVNDLRRGDLVFYASDKGNYRSIFHMGLYIGDGQMIEAPYTGESVRISSIWRSSLFGAARP